MSTAVVVVVSPGMCQDLIESIIQRGDTNERRAQEALASSHILLHQDLPHVIAIYEEWKYKCVPLEKPRVVCLRASGQRRFRWIYIYFGLFIEMNKCVWLSGVDKRVRNEIELIRLH